MTVPLRAGEYVLGVRCSSEELARLVVALFPDRHEPTAEPPPNVSVAAQSRRPDGQVQPLHRLYLRHSRLLRTRSLRRVLDLLWHVVDTFDRQLDAEDALLHGTVLVDGDRAHVFPARMRSWFVDAERHWEKAGFRLVDRTTVALRPDSGHLVVPASGLGLAASEVDVGALGFEDRWDPPRPVGTLDLATWTFQGIVPTPAGRLVAAARQVQNLARPGGRARVEALAALSARTPDVAGFEGRVDLVRRLRGRR